MGTCSWPLDTAAPVLPGAFMSLRVCPHVGETCLLGATFWLNPQLSRGALLCFPKATPLPSSLQVP